MTLPMSIVTGLVPLALSRIADLRGDEAKEAALRVLARAVNEISGPEEAIAEAFERLLSMSRTFSEPAARVRAFADACETITVSVLPLSRRRDLLDRALGLALAAPDVPERVAATAAALDARSELRWSERSEEVLEELARAAADIPDEEARERAVLHIGSSLARSGETDRAQATLGALPPSGRRALGLSRVAFALARQGLDAEAATLLSRVLAEARAAAPSPERSLSLRCLLAFAVESGLDLPQGSALSAGLDLVDALDDPPEQRDALLGAIAALGGTKLEGEALDAALARLDASLERVANLDLRLVLRGRLSVGLAALGETEMAVAGLRSIADAVAQLRAEGVDGPSVALPIALPVLEIMGELADVDLDPEVLQRFAISALDLLAGLDDQRGVAVLLGEMTRFFASPALAYGTRLALLDRTLTVAQSLVVDESRIEVVGHIANALSIGGATERGDGLFAGLVSGIGREGSREVRLSRAVTLVRLGRTADARAEISGAAAASQLTLPHVEELAMCMARCGFLADMLYELDRIDVTLQGDTRAQLADCLVEATYLDPHLREIGLSSLLEGTIGHVRETIACLLDQVRVLEGLGDVEQTLANAFARNAALEERRTAAIFDEQLVDALIERIRSAPQESPAASP
jgi:hypothetical protein